MALQDQLFILGIAIRPLELLTIIGAAPKTKERTSRAVIVHKRHDNIEMKILFLEEMKRVVTVVTSN